ncbi:MAG: class I SAM-dependent methyltransferase [Pyrobaculum sp.]
MIEEVFKDQDQIDLGERVLDVGAGWGTTTEYLLRRGLRVWAVDVDPGSVSYLRSLFKDFVEAGLLEVRLAPAEALPFGDNAFDSVVSVAAAHHFKDVEAALREMDRVAKRMVVIYDWTPESAGVTNPHSAEELEAKMRKVAAAARALGYVFTRRRLWYRLTKQKI